MKFCCRVAGAFALAGFVGAAAQGVSPPPPVAAFGALPAMSSPSLSPDGKHLALIQSRNGRPVATVWTLDPPGSAPVIIPFDEGFIVHAQWVNDRRLMLTINLNAGIWGSGPDAWYRGVIVDADGQNPTALFNNIEDKHLVNGSTATVVDLALNDPDNIYMPLWANYGMMTAPDVRNRLFRVNVNTGRGTMVENGSSKTERFVMDGTGNALARIDETTEPLRDHLIVYTDGSWHEVASIDASSGQGYGIAGPSMDAKSLVQANVLSERTGTKGLSLLSLTDGKLTDLYYDPLYDVTGALRDVWSGRVVGAYYISHAANEVLFDPALKQVHDKLEADFPGMSVLLQTWDAARNKFVFSVEGPRQPMTFYLYNVQAKTLQKLGRTYTNVTPTDLGEVRVYDYAARDGLKIPAYLTVPPGKEAKKLPVVILPHGGPQARDDMDFDWLSQFLANRGYAVLRPNFRGSIGYGQAFEKAGYGQWGLKMQDDVTDGVKKLIADGIADPKRICIAGWSYGGYAALAGGAFTPDLYACVAAMAPVTDLNALLAKTGGQDSWLGSAERMYVGDRWNEAQKLDDVSPAKHADKFKAPVFLMHGEADSTVPVQQSERMEEALKKAGKKVTFVRVPNETHQLQSQENRVRWLTELEKFLKANIGN